MREQSNNGRRDDLSARYPRQRGAALVVSLVLLLVLTLLAISTMGTASLEVTMAGNKQYAENAFQLAETGKDQYLATIRNNTLLCVGDQSATVCDIGDTSVAAMAGTYRTTSRYLGADAACPNSSESEVARFDFEVQATGTSASNAVAQHTQGWFFCRP